MKNLKGKFMQVLMEENEQNGGSDRSALQIT